jgi:hypothetical protein
VQKASFLPVKGRIIFQLIFFIHVPYTISDVIDLIGDLSMAVYNGIVWSFMVMCLLLSSLDTVDHCIMCMRGDAWS